ncbi:hypothetical protein L571_0699 [Bordetella pertussis 2371640]|nr:hypothetical protein L571_0699 [Bordetella pertussis 2371640]
MHGSSEPDLRNWKSQAGGAPRAARHRHARRLPARRHNV